MADITLSLKGFSV